MTDWGLVGHTWAVELLQQNLARGDVRHAYLLSGPEGVGRRTLALAFARALNCLNPLIPGQPCGTCRVCKGFEKQQHIDLSLVRRQPPATELVIDQVRDLQHTLSLSPYEAPYRTAVLQRFEEANASAQNALLKTLEEPPSRAVLLLTADAPESLLPTIVSRCEVLRLRSSKLEDLTAVLQARWGLDENCARLTAHLSGGRTGLALRLAGIIPSEKEDFFAADPDRRRAWLAEISSLLPASRRERFKMVKDITEKRGKSRDDSARVREELRLRLQTWSTFWRDVLLAAAGADTPLINLDRETEVRRLAQQIGVFAARKALTACEQTRAGLAMNLNQQLALEVLMLDWPRANL